MKRCPQCNNLFDDINDYCLNDGTPLTTTIQVDYSSQEMPTVVWNPPTSNPAVVNTPRGGPNTTMYVMFGIIVLLAVTAVGFAVAYFVSGREDATKNPNQTTTSNADNGVSRSNLQNAPVTSTPEKPVVTPTPKAETVRPPGARGGSVHRPPTNVRFSPGGAIQCVVKSRSTINIYGDTGVYDNNGLWYYTDVCGRQGVVHSSQFQFTK